MLEVVLKKKPANQCAKGRSITISERNRADSRLATYGIAPITDESRR